MSGEDVIPAFQLVLGPVLAIGAVPLLVYLGRRRDRVVEEEAGDTYRRFGGRIFAAVGFLGATIMLVAAGGAAFVQGVNHFFS